MGWGWSRGSWVMCRGCGSGSWVVGRGRSHGLWVVGRTEVPFVGFWRGMAVLRALWPCSHWGGGLSPGTGLPRPPCFLPAPPQSRPSEPWAGPRGAGPAPRTLGLKTQSLGSCFMLFDAPCPQTCPLTPAWSSAWSKHSSPVCSAPLGSLSGRWRHHGTQHGTCKRDFRFLAAA